MASHVCTPQNDTCPATHFQDPKQLVRVRGCGLPLPAPALHNVRVHQELVVALAPILRDLRAGCAVPPDIRDGDAATAMVYAPDGTGQGISVIPGAPAAEQVVWLADQVQEWAVEALWTAGHPAVWPECPAHPGTHPLTAGLHDGTPVWACPRTGTPIAAIGNVSAYLPRT
jgi:hypothetical protein